MTPTQIVVLSTLYVFFGLGLFGHFLRHEKFASPSRRIGHVLALLAGRSICQFILARLAPPIFLRGSFMTSPEHHSTGSSCCCRCRSISMGIGPRRVFGAFPRQFCGRQSGHCTQCAHLSMGLKPYRLIPAVAVRLALLDIPASSVADSRPTRTTCASPKTERSAARSATSSPSRSVAAVIAKSIAGDETAWWEKSGY